MHSPHTTQEKHAPSTAPSTSVERASNANTAEQTEHNDATNPASADGYIHGTRLVIVSVSLMLAMFLVSLDNTIISTAIPKITDQFKDITSTSWYGSAYFLTFGGFQSTFGKVYKYFSIKLWFLITLGIFELGSLLCAVAQEPTLLIVGRAIAGLGGAGVSTGIFTTIGLSVPPNQRPALLGYVGSTYGVGAVLGPLLGGLFTDKVSWRWCFYINLPVGGVAVAIFILFFQATGTPAEAPLKEKLLQLDAGGTALIMGMIICYLLALQYGGQTHPWNSGIVIGLLVGFALLLIIFIAWEIFQKDRAMIVPRLFMKRYVLTGSIFVFFFGGAYFAVLYFLPIYFQSVHNMSAISSGVRMLAFIIPLTFAIIAQGPAFMKVGIAPPFWVIGGAVSTIGCGLLYTMDSDTSAGKWIGYQILVGFAFGWTYQIAIENAQVQASQEDMSQTTAIVNFFAIIGGSFFNSAGQSAFNNQIVKHVTERLPDVDSALVLGTGATSIRDVFSPAQIPVIIDAYVLGLKAVFAISIALCGLASIVGVFGSWKKINVDDSKAVGGGI